MKRPEYIEKLNAGEFVVKEVSKPEGKRTREEVFKSARQYVTKKDGEQVGHTKATRKDKKGNPKYSEDYGRNRVKD
jgi:hypothetical protein